ncbi:MAG: acireductone synthase [Thermoplasmatales archaeon]
MQKLQECRVILLDVEGTTTPIEFVRVTLFEYTREHVRDFIDKNWSTSNKRGVLNRLWKMMIKDVESGKFTLDGNAENDRENLVKYTNWLLGIDSKASIFKEIQGLIWQEGYVKGELHGVVYSDVPSALERWSSSGKTVAIYSSGSELSQKLLFSTTPYGDLTIYISEFFDTRIGSKKDPASYTKIAGEIGVKPNDILFLSDSEEELRAASIAGIKSLLVRRGSKKSKDETVSDFLDLC